YRSARRYGDRRSSGPLARPRPCQTRLPDARGVDRRGAGRPGIPEQAQRPQASASIESSAMTPLIDPDLTSPDRRILITGGVRSGKSRYAETLLAESSEVTYIATGPVPDPANDPEWAARIVDHRAQRPAHWSTIETSDVAGMLRSVPGEILVDCLGTWLTAIIDRPGPG